MRIVALSDNPFVDLIALMPAFVVAVLLISASPGPAMALIFRRAAVQRWRGAVPTVLGLELGLYLWALAAAAGFAALVAVSETAYVVAQGGRRRGAAVPRHQGVALRLARRRAPERRRDGVRQGRGGGRSARASWCSSPTRRRRSS